MSQSTQVQVLRFDTWLDPIFDATIKACAGAQLNARRFADAREDNLAALGAAHVLHITPAKDELPREWFVSPELLRHAPRLLCVSSGGAGYDTIDVPACTAAGVAVFNQAGANGDSVAEHALGLMLSVSHRLAESDRALRGTARGFSREDLMGHEIRGKVLGLVGIGEVGMRVAHLARAFGMEVLATDPNLDAATIRERGAVPVSQAELLARADIVSLHCPRLPSTMRMMGAQQFAAMKRGAIFISTARGGIHDEAALAQALDSGHLAGAGLDVWDVEPPPPDHPLLCHPSVIATFHTAGVTHEGRRNVARMAAEGILEVIAGRRPPRLLNPEVLEHWRERYRAVLERPASL